MHLYIQQICFECCVCMHMRMNHAHSYYVRQEEQYSCSQGYFGKEKNQLKSIYIGIFINLDDIVT